VARSSGFSRGHRSSGVARDWNAGPGSSDVVSLSASGSAFLGSGIQPTASEVTCLRTRGLFDAFLTGITTADGDGFTGAVGIGKCTLAAFTAGITAVPTPVTEVGWDGWLWHSFFSIHAGDVSSAAGRSEEHQRILVDSKGMRKFDGAEILYAVVEVVEQGTAVMDVYFDSRMLLQDSGR